MNAKPPPPAVTLSQAKELVRCLADTESLLLLSPPGVGKSDVVQQAARDVPPTAHSRNMAKRFEQHGEACFEFVTTPDVEPTNNLAEQAIRFVVIDRQVTQGTRGEAGRRWCERIWTVIATCSQQGRSVFDYLYAAVQASYQHATAPSLLPNEG